MTADTTPSRMETIGDTKVAIMEVPILEQELAEDIAAAKNLQDNDDAFMVVNLDRLVERFHLWTELMPRIEPFYAVKCNNDRVLLKILSALGIGFDCASKAEIDLVRPQKNFLRFQVLDNNLAPVNKIIYANPCKTRSFIHHAQERKVAMMTFDNAEELSKIAKMHTAPELILRIAVSDPTATCPLNLKFGAEPVNAAPSLLMTAARMNMNVKGISFHVGSGCNDPTAFETAILHARRLFEIGANVGHRMDLLDIGGGFPGSDDLGTPFTKIAGIVNQCLNEYFPVGSGIRLIAEPGRFFAAAPFTLVCNVISATEVPASKITKNEADSEKRGFMYYLNDGVYGSFNCTLFDHVHPVGRPLHEYKEAPKFDTTLWGPTCDSLDQIEAHKLIQKMEVGDWMLFPHMGAYTCAASTTFNGFARPTPYYVISQNTWALLADRL